MGLFSSSRYFKPGKGVEKDAPEKNAFFRFFEIFGRKLGRFIQVNLIYLVVLLPILLTLYAMAYDAMYVAFENMGYTGTYASYTQGNLTVTAIEVGALGNDYVLDVDADKNGTYTVTLYTDRGAAAVDSSNTVDSWFTLYEVSTVDELVAYENSYVSFSGTGELEAIHDASLSGGDGLMSLFTPLLYLAMLYYAKVPQLVQWLLLGISIVLYGPIRCGITYVLRNFSKQSHAWISDVWEKAMENRTQGIIFGLIDCLIIFLVLFNMTYKPSGQSAALLQATKYLTILVALFYVFMRKYIFLMIVTVRLNFISIIRNAWLLAFIGIFRNVFSGLCNLLIWIAVYLLIMAVHPFFEILFIGLLVFSFTNFLSISACFPLVDKYLVQPINELQRQESTDITAEIDDDNT